MIRIAAESCVPESQTVAYRKDSSMSEISAKLIQLKLANLINGTYSPESEDSPWDSFGQVCRQIRESLQVASPVKTFPQQAREQESAPNDQDSGRKCYDSLASYDQMSCSWKTSQHSLFGGLEPFSGKWPRSGMTVNGTAYRLPTLALLTGGTESGLLESGMWPTPRSSKAMGENLDTVKRRVDKRGFLEAKLEEKVAMWPTPKARDWKGKSQRGIHAPMDALPNMDRGDGHPIAGQLNPQFVSWLMGYPVDWCDITDEQQR